MYSKQFNACNVINTASINKELTIVLHYCFGHFDMGPNSWSTRLFLVHALRSSRISTVISIVEVTYVKTQANLHCRVFLYKNTLELSLLSHNITSWRKTTLFGKTCLVNSDGENHYFLILSGFLQLQEYLRRHNKLPAIHNGFYFNLLKRYHSLYSRGNEQIERI